MNKQKLTIVLLSTSLMSTNLFAGELAQSSKEQMKLQSADVSTASTVEKRSAIQGLPNEDGMTLNKGYKNEMYIAFEKKRAENNEISFLVNASLTGEYNLKVRLHSAGNNELALFVDGKELKASVKSCKKDSAPIDVDFGKIKLDKGTYHLRFKRLKFKKSAKSALHVYGVEMASSL